MPYDALPLLQYLGVDMVWTHSPRIVDGKYSVKHRRTRTAMRVATNTTTSNDTADCLSREVSGGHKNHNPNTNMTVIYRRTFRALDNDVSEHILNTQCLTSCQQSLLRFCKQISTPHAATAGLTKPFCTAA
jgi:hypothetical protein